MDKVLESVLQKNNFWYCIEKSSGVSNNCQLVVLNQEDKICKYEKNF
jgi:hypothetical protein